VNPNALQHFYEKHQGMLSDEPIRRLSRVKHKEVVDKCDIIVCWEHDWKNCPKEIDVIELKGVVKSSRIRAYASRPRSKKMRSRTTIQILSMLIVSHELTLILYR